MSFTPPTSADFHLWLLTSRPGDRFVYFEGDLNYAREVALQGEARHQLCALADRIYNSSVDEMVLLCQERLGESNWRYFAVRRRRPHKAPQRIAPTHW